MKRLYWLYLLTALFTSFSCVMAVQHQRPVLAVLYGLTAGLNFVLFLVKRERG